MAVYTKDGAILELAKLRWALRWAFDSLAEDHGPDVWNVVPEFGLDLEQIRAAPGPTPPGGRCECGERLPDVPAHAPERGRFGAVAYLCACGKGWLWSGEGKGGRGLLGWATVDTPAKP